MSANFLVDFPNGAAGGASQFAAATTTTGGFSGVNLSLGDGPVQAILNVGTVAGTTPTLSVKMQEATTDSDAAYTDITGATFTQVTTSQKHESIRFLRTKKYVRGYATVGGTDPSFTLAIEVFSQARKTGSGGGSSIAPQV